MKKHVPIIIVLCRSDAWVSCCQNKADSGTVVAQYGMLARKWARIKIQDGKEGGCIEALQTVAMCLPCLIDSPGGRLNKKDGLTRYGNSHVKDKTS